MYSFMYTKLKNNGDRHMRSAQISTEYAYNYIERAVMSFR